MADILSQEEIDALLDVVDDDEDRRSTTKRTLTNKEFRKRFPNIEFDIGETFYWVDNKNNLKSSCIEKAEHAVVTYLGGSVRDNYKMVVKGIQSVNEIPLYESTTIRKYTKSLTTTNIGEAKVERGRLSGIRLKALEAEMRILRKNVEEGYSILDMYPHYGI